MSDPVLLNSLADGLRTLTLNRPERRNALSAELVGQLTDALHAAAGDPETRVVVLTGAGSQAFCSGADLNPAAIADGPFAMHQDRRRFVALIRAMRDLGKPIIARVNGSVLAGGLGVMAACDMVVSVDDAEFSTPEIKVGLFPMMIMAIIVRNIGRKKAMELLLTAEKLSAQEAERIGLINRAVPRDQLDASVHALASRLASFSPAILRLGRDAFYRTEDMPLDDALEYLCSQLTVTALTEDAAEGVSAFVMKRPPQWKGR